METDRERLEKLAEMTGIEADRIESEKLTQDEFHKLVQATQELDQQPE